jgi:hypothetical protein
MIPRLLIVSALLVATTACGSRGDDCQWPAERPQSLNLAQPADARHLRRDVELAEDLSIRYGDVRWGPGLERQRGRDEQCLTSLLAHIAQRHGVSIDEILKARESLAHKGANLAVNVPTALFFAVITWLMLRRIHTRFAAQDELPAIAMASLLAALAVGGVTVAFGRLWEAVFEMVRLGNDHLSYRGLRQQWIQLAPTFFASSAMFFLLIALGVGWRKAWIRKKTAEHAV